ncbi:hypothetical protein ABT352_33100 [Streptosporangium sp. NPDC000563]|uniref:hypothetical protein n=1 Tax=Streptosporangium sp. NPDC000563 TaxID=3154366 RepID=UPI00331CC52A
MDRPGFNYFTAHTAAELRFFLDGPAGVVELRITPAYAVLIVGEEAEALPGEEIAVLWRAAGQDDAVVWGELGRRYGVATAPPAPAEPWELGAEFAGLRAAVAWCEFAEEHGGSGDVTAAEEAHLEALREFFRGREV